jgi:hypothetical protein
VSAVVGSGWSVEVLCHAPHGGAAPRRPEERGINGPGTARGSTGFLGGPIRGRHRPSPKAREGERSVRLLWLVPTSSPSSGPDRGWTTDRAEPQQVPITAVGHPLQRGSASHPSGRRRGSRVGGSVGTVDPPQARGCTGAIRSPAAEQRTDLSGPQRPEPKAPSHERTEPYTDDDRSLWSSRSPLGFGRPRRSPSTPGAAYGAAGGPPRHPARAASRAVRLGYIALCHDLRSQAAAILGLGHARIPTRAGPRRRPRGGPSIASIASTAPPVTGTGATPSSSPSTRAPLPRGVRAERLPNAPYHADPPVPSRRVRVR